MCCAAQAITMGMMLAAEPAENDIMDRPPRRPGKRLLGKLILWRCAFVSGLLVILVLGMYGECMKTLLCLRAGADAAKCTSLHSHVQCSTAFQAGCLLHR
jgi:magnesium-transporting ATPase (P-type)